MKRNESKTDRYTGTLVTTENVEPLIVIGDARRSAGSVNLIHMDIRTDHKKVRNH